MDPLGTLDAEFVEAEDEDRHVSMAISSMAVFEGPAPAYDEFVAFIESRLPLVPRYRQKVRTVPLRLGPPVWVDDSGFDVRYHVRQTAVAPPGGDAELSKLMGRVMSQRLDRDRPLWEYWLVFGLAEGRWALISKVHHCMVDGVSGTDLYRVIFDPNPVDGAPSEPGATPSSVAVDARSIAEVARVPLRLGRAAATRLAHPMRAVSTTRTTARATTQLLRGLWPAHPSSLSGPIGQQRRYLSVAVPLADVKTIKAALGGTVNDVVMAAITNGFRALLISRGETPTARTVPSLVPVSLRAPGEEDILENRVSGMIVHLPVHLADPAAQLAAVRRILAQLKEAQEAAAFQAFVAVSSYVPYPVASLSRLALRLPQREIVTVTTNVPGPRQTLRCLGRELVDIRPYVPIASTVRVGVAIFSYRERITFGLTGDYDSTPDLDVLADGIEEGLADLLKLAAARPVAG